MGGIFTISLDFELHWGVFDKKERESQKHCYQNTIELIPRLLDLFSKYEVHVTWATVGSLLAENVDEWNQLKPSILPSFNDEKYSAYAYAAKNGLNNQVAWAHFAPRSVFQILQHPGQELGTHTFAHYYCLEPQQSKEAFQADLAAANEASAKFQNQLTSLVFPRNQFEPGYLDICFKQGIRTVRSNPADWFWKPVADSKSGLMRKIFRSGDAYLPLGKRTSYPLETIKRTPNQPLQLPASRFLRAWQPSYPLANRVHAIRVKSELSAAATYDECYHLWWHPENFGSHPEENISQLEDFLKHYQTLKDKYGMRSWNMGEYCKALN
jgi:peptidoglycan/xylan/chitin deacetylase (PgdA/CDA1 family)